MNITSVLKGKYLVLFAEMNFKVKYSVSSSMVSFIINIEAQLVLWLYCDCPAVNLSDNDEIKQSAPMVAKLKMEKKQ